MASNTYNLNTWAAKRIIGDNSSASPESALLHNGGGRGNTAAGDTWIFYDDASGSGTPWGIKHDQVSDKISLFGNGTNTSWVSLGTGNLYTDGKIGIGYDPGTSGNTYKLYVDGTGYFNDDITSNKSIWFGENSTSGKAILGFNSTYSNYGIWYFNESVDVMTLSASGNADGKTDADFGINVHGAGTLTNRNNRIPHTGNTTGTVGGTEQPVYVNAGTISSTSYALKATVNNSTAGYIAYYSADRAISGTSSARITAQGTLSLFPTGGSYRDGMRIHARTTDNTWAAILLCGADNTGDSGTSANTWFIGNNGTGSLYLGRNGTGSSGTFLRCVNNVWEWNGTATGNISGNAGTATKLSNTPNTTSTFLRGDNTWTNELLGPLKIGASDAAANTGYASANVGSQNYIAFYGVYGDNPGGYNHTYIGESIYGSKTAANEQSELLLFHGNDPAASSGPDRIRLFAGQVDICVYTSALSGTWDTIRANAGTKVANFANGVMTVTGNILPEANGTRALGSSTYEWGTTYTRTIYARHFDASQNYTSNLDMYYGYNRASNHYFYTMDGTTRTHRATISATGLYINQPAGNRNAGIIGQYDSTKAALIWTMGSGYNIKADGTTLGNLYGAAYAHTNATGALGSRTLAGGHQFLWCQNGGVNVALGNNIWTNGSLYINGADHGVYYNGSKSTERMIRFIDNTSGTDGNGMIIGGAGYMGVGSGESAGQSYSGAGYSAGSEVLVLSSDGDIRLLPTQQSGYNVAYETLITTNGIWVGKDGNTTREMDICVRSGAGSMYMWAAAATNGARGIWVPAHGTGAAKAVFQVDTNNAVTFNGTLSGNASTATQLKTARKLWGNSFDGTADISGDITLTTASADSPDIVWMYGNTSKEQARIWMGSGGTSTFAPSYRCYKSDGTSLYSGHLVLGNGTGASGSWGISVTGSSDSCTGNAATATRVICPDAAVSYVDGAKGTNAAVFAKKTYNQNHWYPAVALQTKGGGAWQIGNYNDETLEFVYFPKDKIDSSTNSGQTEVYITSAGVFSGSISGNAATATKATQDGSGNTITSYYCTLSTAQNFTGNKSWGTNGAGGYLNGTATNGGINSIRIGDDVWLGDCNTGGIMGMKSTGANCGFYFYNSSGTAIGQLYSTNSTQLYTNLEVRSASANAFRLSYGNYGVILRNDGSQFYFLITDSGSAATGSWNSLRPFQLNLATGKCIMDGNATGLTGGLVTNTVTSHGNLAVTTAKGSYYGINFGHNTSGMSIMSINASHQGLYNQANGQWILYYNAASTSKSIVLGNSTVNVTGGISLNLNTKVTGTLTISSHCYFANGTTYYINSSGTGNLNALTVNATTASSSTATGALIVKGGIGAAGKIYGSQVYNAVWNDYAECRQVETEEPGRCVTESSNGKMILTQKRLMPGCKLTSDTFGACMGETEKAKTPIAVAGRVLAYPYRDRNEYKLGAAVCSAPDGTVDIMTRAEIMMYPERIVGIVSEIPDYEIWYGGTKENPIEIKVNNRIWIYVR